MAKHYDLKRIFILLTEAFSESELRRLCSLEPDFRSLSHQLSQSASKDIIAKQLLEYANRELLIDSLLTIAKEHSPARYEHHQPYYTDRTSTVADRNQQSVGIPSTRFPEDDSPTSDGRSERVGEALIVLISELMESPEARGAVAAYRADFEATCAQIDLLGDYKELHDLLHALQFYCYNPIVREARRFPDDDLVIDTFMDYELTLQQIVNDLNEVTERTSVTMTETFWIQHLGKAQETLRGAIELSNVELLNMAIWLLSRVLSIQPSNINNRLISAARALRMSALVEAFADIHDNWTRLDLDPERADQFKVGLDALVSLNKNLDTLIDEHDRWQAVDDELRRIGANLGKDTNELERSWPYLKDMTEPLYGSSVEEWATSFKGESENLETALAVKNPVQIRKYFHLYRRRASQRFHQVDIALKDLCENLRKVDDPLVSVVRMIE